MIGRTFSRLLGLCLLGNGNRRAGPPPGRTRRRAARRCPGASSVHRSEHHHRSAGCGNDAPARYRATSPSLTSECLAGRQHRPYPSLIRTPCREWPRRLLKNRYSGEQKPDCLPALQPLPSECQLDDWQYHLSVTDVPTVVTTAEPASRVRWTGHLPAISMAFSLAASPGSLSNRIDRSN